MSDIHLSNVGSIDGLVAALPEKYQPIFAHPELSEGNSRDCEDRLGLILDVVAKLRSELGRPPRVLDIGCAQGFFSLNLADRGCIVHGVDYLERNIEVCQALASEAGMTGISFECGRVEASIGRLELGQYDLVLGLSLFHHLVHEHGLEFTQQLIDRLAQCVTVGIYELAVRDEPVYWAASLPQNPEQLLQSYGFLRVMSHQPTHLSGIARPLYYASNKYWLLQQDFRRFERWQTRSHSNEMNVHAGTRRYFFSGAVVLKKMSLDDPALKQVNLEEYVNEVAFLQAAPVGVPQPRLLEYFDDGQAVWILREALPGRLLSELIEAKQPYAYEQVVDGIIDQLATLEAAGLYHNDIRCWNLLLDEDGRVAFIDYGAISTTPRDCVWPDDLLLSWLITTRELVQGWVQPPIPLRRPLLDVALLPSHYREAFRSVLSLPREDWSFRALRDALAEPVKATPISGWEHLLAKQREAFNVYEQNLLALRDENAKTQSRLDESLKNAHHWYLEATQGRTQLTGLSELRASEADSKHQLYLRFQELSRHYEADKQELVGVRNELSQSLSNAHHWFTRATTLERQLNELHESTSWRITRPLRALSIICRRKRGLRIVIKRCLGLLMQRLLRHPTASPRLNAALRRYSPTLHARLRSVAEQQGLVQPQQIHSAVGQVGAVVNSGEQSLSLLSPRGRAFLDALTADAGGNG